MRGQGAWEYTAKLLLDPPRGEGRQELFHLRDTQPSISSGKHSPQALPKFRLASRLGGPVLSRLLIAISLSLISSCAPQKASPADARVFTDELGRKVKVTPYPQRIVSLAPSITETLFALGLGDRVVGVTSFCDYPPEARQKEIVGDTMRPGLEKIVALKPDLVIASTASQLEQFVRKLDEMAIPIYVSNPRDVEGVLSTIAGIGELTGASESANELVGKMRARLEEIHNRVATCKPPRVLFILGTQPLITVGGHTFINDLVSRAGGQSISEDETSEYPQYSLETAVARQPEVIFLQAGEGELPDRLKQTPAAQSGRVFHLDDNLLLRPGPRIIEGLDEMAKRICP